MESVTKDPIFLVGCPRSGTTLLQRMLDCHSQLAIAPETRFIQRFWLNRKVYGELNDDLNFQRLINDIVAIPEFGDMKIDPKVFIDMAWVSERTYPALFRLLLNLFGQNKQAKILGEKTPDHLLFLLTLLEFFPETKFIHIVRDPRAVVNSWRKMPWSGGNLNQDILACKNYLVTARKYPSYIKSLILTVHYEQLICLPEYTLRKICNFIKVDFQMKMLNFYEDNFENINLEREPWKINVKYPLNLKMIDQWQEDLSKKEVEEIEICLWYDMLVLRYIPVSNKFYLIKQIVSSYLK